MKIYYLSGTPVGPSNTNKLMLIAESDEDAIQQAEHLLKDVVIDSVQELQSNKATLD